MSSLSWKAGVAGLAMAAATAYALAQMPSGHSGTQEGGMPGDMHSRMMQMMLALDAEQFHGERAVTCYTCHRGSSKPVSIPMLDSTAPYVSEARSAAEPAPAPRTDLPSADDVIEKYIRAVGGAATIQNVLSRVESGTVTFAVGPPFPIEILSKSPSRQA